MQAGIEPLHFLIFGDAKADGGIHDLEDHQGSYDTEAPGDGNADSLIEHLAGVAVDQAEGLSFAGGVFERVVDGIGGEDAGEDCADRSARAVDTEGIEGIVVAELLFDRG